jgi:lysozyme
VLTAYPDPGTGGDPWTIGYGHTGPDVRPGNKITQNTADQLLVGDLKRFEDAVSRLIDVTLTQHEFDAIVSFTFNTGAGSLEHSTFRRRINAGEDKATCFREEFPKWVNGGNGPMPGLIRRRNAEVALATS